MRVALGKFAISGIEAHFGTDIVAAVQAALLHYTRRLKSRWPPIGVPRCCLDRTPRDPGVAFIKLTVAPETRAVLEREAGRHRVPVGQILVHAVFVYLADLDSPPEGESDAG